MATFNVANQFSMSGFNVAQFRAFRWTQSGSQVVGRKGNLEVQLTGPTLEGEELSGTVTGIVLRKSGTQVWQWQAPAAEAVDIDELLEAVEDRDTEAFFAALLGGTDTLNGGNGNDVLYGFAGVDTVNGGAGNDRLYGGEEGDNLYGEAGNDRLFGEAGVDQLYGGAGNDQLYGGDEGDFLFGQDGNDRLVGGAGDDDLDGGLGNDRLEGGAGNDTLISGSGRDKMIGGTGEDTFVIANETTNIQIDEVLDFRRSDDTLAFGSLLGDVDLAAANAAQYIRIEQIGADRYRVSVDRDGTATQYSFEAVAIVRGDLGTDVVQLVQSAVIVNYTPEAP